MAEKVDIFRKYSDWFVPDLAEDSSVMDSLVEEGLKGYDMDQREFLNYDSRQEFEAFAKASLRREFLIFAKLSQTDPDLRERFLREDLSDTDR